MYPYLLGQLNQVDVMCILIFTMTVESSVVPARSRLEADWKPIGEDWKPIRGLEADWKPIGEDWKPIGEDWKPIGEDWKPIGYCRIRLAKQSMDR